jgi:hypothetical protein
MKTIFAASALISCAASHALAGPCDSIYRYGVPDFDQQRSGLLDNGNQHCVPTSALNWMAYARNHGLANTMGHTSPNWAAASEYAHVTTRLDKMGDLMETDSGGTTIGWAAEGLRRYFDFYNVPAWFTFTGYVAGENWTPSPTAMRYFLANGNLVNFCFGRYNLVGSRWDRDGGHCMSLIGVRNPCAANPAILFKNPSAGDSILSQSAFETGSWTVTSAVRNIGGETRTVWEPTGQDGVTTNRKFIDKLLVMHPFFGWTAPPTSSGFVLVNPAFLNNVLQAQVVVQSPNGASTTGFAISPREPGFFASTASDNNNPAQLWFYSQAEERFTLITSLGTRAGFFGLATTRQGDLIAIGGGTIRKYRVPGDGSVRLLQETAIPYNTNAIAIDDSTDDVYVLARDRRRLLRYADADLLLPASDYNLPSQIVLSGECSMSVDPTDAHPWITSEGSGAAYELSRAATTDQILLASTEPLTQYPSPRSLRFDDRGGMRFISGGLVRALKYNPDTRHYVPDPDAPLADTPANGFLDISVSRDNFEPARDQTPGWRDVTPSRDPSETIDCPADFNGDNQVDFFDYLDFVAALEGNDYDADVNFDLVLDFFDYLDFVGWYSGGC